MTPLPSNQATSASSGFTTYEGADLTGDLLSALATSVCRMTGTSLPRARALLGWAQQVVVERDARGATAGVHAFRFADVSVNGDSCRLVYAILVAVAPGRSNREILIRRVGTQVYRQQRLASPKVPVIWVNGPGCDAGTPFPVDTDNPARPLAIRAPSAIPHNLRFYTDHPAGDGIGGIVPPAIEMVTAKLIGEQRALEAQARSAGVSGFTGWRRAAVGLTTAAGLAAGFLVWHRPTASPDAVPVEDAVRMKGSPNLHVFKQTEKGSEELLSGSPIAAGDRVRFTVDVPGPRRVRVIGVQANGDVYTAWPPPGYVAWPLPAPGSPENDVIPAGVRQELPGAVAFDASSGREKLYLVSCPPEIHAPTCTGRGPGVEPACPSECRLTPFAINKRN